MSQLKALIFDVDGTLADTEDLHRQAFNAAFADFGLSWEWSPQLYAELLSISGGQERILRYAEELHEATLPSDLPEFVRRLHLAKSAHYRRMLLKNPAPLRPGVRRLIEEARAQSVRLAIATSSTLPNVRILLDQQLPVGWDSWFEVIATCDTIKAKKPSPAVYEYIVARMALAPAECIAVEDTGNGNRAALAAGLNTIITTHIFTREHNFLGASLVLTHLGEPDRPLEVISGHSHGASYVDIELIRKLQRRARPDNRVVTATKPLAATA